MAPRVGGSYDQNQGRSMRMEPDVTVEGKAITVGWKPCADEAATYRVFRIDGGESLVNVVSRLA